MRAEDRAFRPAGGIRLTCREVSQLVSEGMDGELPASERVRLRLHFVICDACRRTQQQFRLLRGAVRSLERERSGQADGDSRG
jgi:predicted anti-sigma-YlaC factor YlaD